MLKFVRSAHKERVFYERSPEISEIWVFGSHKISIPKPPLISGRNDLNRAMNEDIVAVRVKAEAEWKAPSSRCLDSELQPGADEAEAVINRGKFSLILRNQLWLQNYL